MGGWWACEGSTSTRTLRSIGWDGPAPRSGDMLVDRHEQHWLIDSAVHGAGLGHYRLEVHAIDEVIARSHDGRVFAWHDQSS